MVSNFSSSLISKVVSSFILLLGFSYSADCQDVMLHNPSFEDTPRRGSNISPKIKGWFDCGRVLFPEASPPDIHQGNTNFWSSKIASAHGKTYMSLVVRDNDSFESVSQKVVGTLKSGNCYTFSISLVQSADYWSATQSNTLKESNFNKPTVLQVWGGNSFCDAKELLAESKPVTKNSWETHELKIEPSTDCTYIILRAFFVTPTLYGYNGHICLDNASDFKVTNCDTGEIVAAVETPAKKTRKTQPKKPQKPTVEKIVKTRDTKTPQTGVAAAPERNRKSDEKELLGYGRKKLAIGQQFKIDKLYFRMDSVGLEERSFSVLNEVYEFLDLYKEVTIEVGGHTNTIPSDKYCDELSTKRAKAAADYLITKGIAEERISYKGYGKRKPITRLKTPAGRRLNQRVQIKITSLG